MPLVVHSPYSGKPVKVRDEDVNRAIRDEEGRIFYVVQRSTGEGYYASPTRQGSEKDEQRYLKMIEKSAAVEQHKRTTTAQAVHDATGKARTKATGKLVRAIVALVLLLGLIYIVLGITDNLPDAVPNFFRGIGEPEASWQHEHAYASVSVLAMPWPGVVTVDVAVFTAAPDAQPALESTTSASMSGADKSEWPINC